MNQKCRWCGSTGPLVLKTYQDGNGEGMGYIQSWVCTLDGETYDAEGCRARRSP